MSQSSSLFMRETGPQDAPSILFLHGGGAAGWMWQPVVDRLPEYHCLIPDLPDHGGSRGSTPFRMDLAATAVAQVIRARADGGVAHVVGLSEGAQVAVQMLATVPDLISRAVVSSALLRPLPGAGWLMSPRLLAWTYRWMMKPLRNNDGWIRLNMKYAAGIPTAFFPHFRQEFSQMTEHGFVNLMMANQQFRLPPGLAQVHVPVLIVVGRKEYGVMKQSARDLAEVLPASRAVEVNLGRHSSLAAEHNWALNAPDLFAQTVRAWLTDAPLPLNWIHYRAAKAEV